MRDAPRIVWWIQRLSEIALVCLLGVLLLGDVALAASMRYGQLAVPLIGLLGIGAYLLRRRFRVQGVVLLMAVSVTVSVIAFAFRWRGLPGFAESGALLLLTVGVLRWVRPLRTAVILTLLSMLTLELNSGLRTPDNVAVVWGFMLFVLWAIAMGVGSYLRYQLERREQTVHAVRRAERLELARELHDLVAHHITGIVVQAQAARTVAAQRPDTVVPALDAIAGAGSEALTSMRRLVGVLRAEDDAARNPGVTFHDLRLLVERFATGGPPVAFDIAQGVSEASMAPEVLTTLHRVLQESLTNIRRHAPGTGWVQADLRHAEGGAVLRVRNHRSGSDPRVSRLGGGFGLVGMNERVTAVGGRMFAGPTPDGAWEVRAWFPAPNA
ncbi:two-component sensor histidine kinase [Sphaerisporangium album]|uniref:histidine kinase n=1 Tax=Sphaerisporangium album TaxID=509200 RepID=A0A367FNP1_9ACTN|nr:histidine kinase [Sphaerisporangium album]RCG31300.1 two-component sensor histidine kinase [Sphaerisporangium album]